MKNVFKFKSIRMKLLASFLPITIMVFGFSFYLISSISKLEDNTRHLSEEAIPQLSADFVFLGLVTQQQSELRGYLLTGEEKYKQIYLQLKDYSISTQKQMLDSVDSNEVKDVTKETNEVYEVIEKSFFPAYEQGNTEEAKEILRTEIEPVLATVVEKMTGLAMARGEVSRENGTKALQLAKSTFVTSLIFGFLLLFIIIILATIIPKTIAKPIHILKERMDFIADGNLANEPLAIRSHDEIGSLVNSSNMVNQNLRVILTKIQNVSNALFTQSNLLTKTSYEVKEGSNQISITMQELAIGSEKQVNITSNLSTTMNSFANEVNNANNSGEKIHRASQQVLQLTREGSKLMSLSINQMEMIDQIVKEAVHKVKGLNDQSQEVSKLVSVIKGIAEQTNLLALNAAIEAARAGEHGKGFAIVADNVRKLAEQVSMSVTDITQIVSNIQNETQIVSSTLKSGYIEVENGREQIVSTGHTFREIEHSLNQMAEGVQYISHSINSMANSSESINISLSEFASASEESAAGIEQTAASVEQSNKYMEEVTLSAGKLNNLADELNQLISRFTI
jgi:methyl-accepting chemotaxis protein